MKAIRFFPLFPNLFPLFLPCQVLLTKEKVRCTSMLVSLFHSLSDW